MALNAEAEVFEGNVVAFLHAGEVRKREHTERHDKAACQSLNVEFARLVRIDGMISDSRLRESRRTLNRAAGRSGT